MENEFVANDFVAIRKAMEDLKQETKTPCGKCEGGGWMMIWSNRPPAFDVCDECYNPEGLPSP